MTEQVLGITERSRDLFLAYAKDAGNWGGTPLVGGNVHQGEAENGNLTQLKQVGLLKTFRWDGDMWIEFTDSGRRFAAEYSITI